MKTKKKGIVLITIGWIFITISVFVLIGMLLQPFYRDSSIESLLNQPDIDSMVNSIFFIIGANTLNLFALFFGIFTMVRKNKQAKFLIIASVVLFCIVTGILFLPSSESAMKIQSDSMTIKHPQKKPTESLSQAIETGDIEQVKLLISKGADVNAKGKWNATPLHFAAMGDKEVAELLIDKGADVNAKDKDGTTPLHIAALSKRKGVAELLIANGANADVKDRFGWTPLQNATLTGKRNVVDLLIAKGANVNAKNEKGQTALSLAKEKGHTEIVELLLENGAKE